MENCNVKFDNGCREKIVSINWRIFRTICDKVNAALEMKGIKDYNIDGLHIHKTTFCNGFERCERFEVSIVTDDGNVIRTDIDKDMAERGLKIKKV